MNAGNMGRPQALETLEAIWGAVRAIPRGEVATYGSVAASAGLPGRARLVGHALKVAPRALKLPWHRVVGAGGRIAFPRDSRHYQLQWQRLAAEGVVVLRGRVVSKPRAVLDELLWKPRRAPAPRPRVLHRGTRTR